MSDNPYLRSRPRRENPYRKALQDGSSSLSSSASQHLSDLIPTLAELETPPRSYQSASSAPPDGAPAEPPMADRSGFQQPLNRYESAATNSPVRVSPYRSARAPGGAKPISQATHAQAATRRGATEDSAETSYKKAIAREHEAQQPQQQKTQQGSTPAESPKPEALKAKPQHPETTPQARLERQAREFLRRIDERDPWEGERRWFEELAAAHYSSRLEAAIEFIQATHETTQEKIN